MYITVTKNSTKNSYIPFIQIPQMLTFYHISSSIFVLALLSLHMDEFTDTGMHSIFFPEYFVSNCKPDALLPLNLL